MGRALEVFKQVCDLEGEERARVLAQQCGGDDELRRRVEGWLASEGRATALDRPVLGGVARRMADQLFGDDRDDRDEEPLPDVVGPYRVVRRIGAGGMGVVYEAWQQHPRRRVALKTTHRWMRSPADLERFREEVQALGSLLHPVIPQVYEAIEANGAPWLAMELVDGERIDRAVAGWAPERVLSLVATLAEGVAHAAARGLVHGDIKPGNVLVTADGLPKLLDFGLARPIGSRRAGGTEGWESPGQRADPAEPPDPRTDVHALGQLTRALVGEGDPDVAAIVSRATSLRREDRYPSAGDFADDVRRRLRKLPVRARPWTVRYRLERFVVRRRALLLAASAPVAVVLLVAFAWVGVDVFASRAREAAAEDDRVALEGRMAEEDDDDALLDAFAALPEHQGTRALAVALADRGRALLAEGRYEPALDVLAKAWLQATDDGLRRDALEAIGRVAIARDDGDGVRRVVKALGDAPDDLRAADALSRRDLAAAADAGGPLAGVLRQLSATKDLHVAMGNYGERTLADGDGVLVLDYAHTIWRVGRDLVAREHDVVPPVMDLTAARGPWLLSAGGERVVIAAGEAAGGHGDGAGAGGHDGAGGFWVWRGDRDPVPLGHDAPISATVHEGAVYVGTSEPRSLLRLGADGALDHPHPPTDATGSDVASLTSCDLDGDGVPELVGALGPWRAFDVRVWDDDPASAGQLRLRADLQVGYVSDVFCFRGADGGEKLGVVRVDAIDPPFPAPLAVGLHVLALHGDELVPERSVALPDVPSEWGRPLVGDLDGDGLDDLAVPLERPHRIRLLRQLPDGSFAAASLPGLQPVGLAQLDDDAAMELLASDFQDLYVLGAGGDELPRLDVPDEASPRDAPAAVEVLARIGLPDRAATELARLATISTGDDAARKYLRASELATRASAGYEERLRGAGWAEAAAGRATSPEIVARARAQAARAWTDVGDFDRARPFLDASDDPAAARAADPGPWKVVDGWEVVAPESVGADGTLRAWSDQGDLLRRRVHLDGGAFALALDVDVSRLEIGSGVKLLLRGQGEERSIGVSAFGGATTARLRTTCPGVEAIASTIPVEDVGVSARMSWTSRPGGGVCVLDPPREAYPTLPDALPAGDYDLVVASAGVAWSVEQLAVVAPRRVAVRGMTLLPVQPGDADRVATDPAGALPELVRDRRWEWALLAALETEDLPTARQAVAALGPDDAMLRRLLRTNHRALLPMLGEREGPAAYGATWAMAARWVGTRAVEDALDEPWLATWTSSDPDWLGLQLRRAELAGRRGQGELRRRILEKVAASGGETGRTAHRELAIVAFAAGDVERARAELAAWQEGSKTPDLDRVELRRDHPELMALLP